MDHQLSFADSKYQNKQRKTRKEKLLERMDRLVPWKMMTEVIEPHYPKARNGLCPYPLGTILRIHCMQQ